MSGPAVRLEDNGKGGRFVILEGGMEASEMTFSWAGADKFIIDHTSVEPAYGGRGFGLAMLRAAVDYARSKDAKIIPLCPFARAQFEKLGEIRDALA